MREALQFAGREAFRDWLAKNGSSSEGVWLVFGRKGGPVTITPGDALEEALCFGWIDGQIRSMDDTKYIKYFARRTKKSIWSDRNKKLALELIERGVLEQPGMAAIENAKQNGTWDESERTHVGDEQIEQFCQILRQYEPASTNFSKMSSSVRRTYTALYLDAKTDKTRQARLARIVDRLNKNLKPM